MLDSNNNISIGQKIEAIIIDDLEKTNPTSAEDVYKYRDKHFLSGNQDKLFLDYIEQKKLPKW